MSPNMHAAFLPEYQDGLRREDFVQALRLACVGVAQELRRVHGYDLVAIGAGVVEAAKRAADGGTHDPGPDHPAGATTPGRDAVLGASGCLLWLRWIWDAQARDGNEEFRGDPAELFVTTSQRVAANLGYEMSLLADIPIADRDAP